MIVPHFRPVDTDNLEYGVRQALADNGAADVHVQAVWLEDLASLRVRIVVSDMVEPLQRFTVKIAESIARMSCKAFIHPLGSVYSIVESEREVRRWSYVDP